MRATGMRAPPADEHTHARETHATRQPAFGDMIPWGDPSWYAGYNSPYYRASHHKLRVAVRAFVEKEIMPFCNKWDEAKALPRDLLQKCAKAGWLPAVVGAPWPKDFAPEHPDIKADEWDQFHELILIDELARTGSGSVLRMDPDNGEVTDSFELGAGAFASQPIVHDGWIYAGTKRGAVVAHDTGQPELTGWEMLGGGPARQGSVLEEDS